jgi:hypothetical protein
MIIVLKVILGFMAIAAGFVGWNIFGDYKGTRKQDGYDELSIWRRLRFNTTFFFMILGIVSLMVFFVYFIFCKMTLG